MACAKFIHRFQPAFIEFITPSPAKQPRRRRISKTYPFLSSLCPGRRPAAGGWQKNPRQPVLSLSNGFVVNPFSVPRNSLDNQLSLMYNTHRTNIEVVDPPAAGSAFGGIHIKLINIVDPPMVESIPGMKNHKNNQNSHPDSVGIPQFCSLFFAFPTFPSCLSCHKIIPIVPLFLPMDYFSVLFLSLGDAFSVAISFVPLRLCGHESIMQNKPNFQNPKPNATTYATKSYTNIPPHRTQKNKPKQTQVASRTPGQIEAKPRSEQGPGVRRGCTSGPNSNPIPHTQAPGQIEAEPRSRCTSGPNLPQRSPDRSGVIQFVRRYMSKQRYSRLGRSSSCGRPRLWVYQLARMYGPRSSRAGPAAGSRADARCDTRRSRPEQRLWPASERPSPRPWSPRAATPPAPFRLRP